MKKVVMMVLMLMIMSSVESYAGKGIFGWLFCCCDDDVVEYDRIQDRSLDTPIISRHVVSDRSLDRPVISRPVVSSFEEFERNFTANAKENMCGTMVRNGEVENRKICISNENIVGYVCGGYVQEGSVYSSELKIINTRVGNSVYGARVLIGKASSNIVEITDGNVEGDVFGGLVCDRGDFAHRNRVSINNATIKKNVYGSKSGIGQGNQSSVEINNGNIGGSVYGGSCGKGLASDNNVLINLGEINGDVYGGSCEDGSAFGNKIIINSASVKGVVCGSRGGGRADARCSRGAYGIVEINNSEIAKDIYGGRCDEGDAYDCIVIINGGNICGDVYGGYGSDLVRRNTVRISGSPTFSTSTIIYGGYSPSEAAGVFAENTLNWETEEPVLLKGVKNFEQYNFGNVIANAPAVLRVEDDVDLMRSKVGVKVEGEAKEGDRLNLIESQGVVSQAEGINIVRNGLVEYEYSRLEGPNLLTLIIRGLRARPQAQVINEVAGAGIVVVGQGIGFIADRGIEEAVGAVKGKEGIEVFGVVEGERNKYKDVGGLKIEGLKGVGGISKGFKGGEVVIGGYIEHGKGDYRVEEVEGRGGVNYTGLGGLVRKLVGERWYIDGSVNVGGYGVEYESEINKEDIGYEYKGIYVGGHVGIGYKLEVSKNINIEMIGKMLLTRQGGKELKLNNGVAVDIGEATSGKIKGKVKAEYKCNESVVPYIGIGYEYEFLGKSEASVEGVELKEVDLRGGSGIGEIGVSSVIGDININLSSRGCIGEREGMEGMLKVGYTI
jgi:hypothetical protein